MEIWPYKSGSLQWLEFFKLPSLVELSQGSSFTFGLKKRARKAAMLRGEWKWLLPLKRQLLLKARKRKNIFLWKLGICESLFRSGWIGDGSGQRLRFLWSHFHFQVCPASSPGGRAGPDQTTQEICLSRFLGFTFIPFEKRSARLENILSGNNQINKYVHMKCTGVNICSMNKLNWKNVLSDFSS